MRRAPRLLRKLATQLMLLPRAQGCASRCLEGRVMLHVELSCLLYCRVYRGSLRGATVAVKVVEHGLGASPTGSGPGDPSEEALLLCGLAHPNIVRVFKTATLRLQGAAAPSGGSSSWVSLTPRPLSPAPADSPFGGPASPGTTIPPMGAADPALNPDLPADDMATVNLVALAAAAAASTGSRRSGSASRAGSGGGGIGGSSSAMQASGAVEGGACSSASGGGAGAGSSGPLSAALGQYEVRAFVLRLAEPHLLFMRDPETQPPAPPPTRHVPCPALPCPALPCPILPRPRRPGWCWSTVSEGRWRMPSGSGCCGAQTAAAARCVVAGGWRMAAA